MAELADALVSEASDASHEGSTPSLRTMSMHKLIFLPIYLVFLVTYGCASMRPANNLNKGSLRQEPARGMTKKEVTALWGEPRRISSFSFNTGDSEVWFYGGCEPDCSILYFGKEGKLNSIFQPKKNTP